MDPGRRREDDWKFNAIARFRFPLCQILAMRLAFTRHWLYRFWRPDLGGSDTKAMSLKSFTFRASMLLMLLTQAAWAQSNETAAAGAAAQLTQLFADEREAYWTSEPLAASGEGVHRFDDRLPTVTPASQGVRLKTDQALFARLQLIDAKTLPAQARVSYALFEFMLRQRIVLARHREWRMPLNSDSGFHADILYMHENAELRTVADFDRYLARLRDVPRYFDENISNMRLGLKDGFTLPREILDGVAAVIAGEQFTEVNDSPLFAPFENYPIGVPVAERARLTKAAEIAIRSSIIPAYAKFQQFFKSEYQPKARRTIAASALPGGKEYYADLARYFTTLPDVTPEQIHQIGLDEVKRIRTEMDSIIRELKFKGSFADFLTFLRTDPQFYVSTPDELVREASWLAKQVDGRLPEFFGHLPRTPYGVRPVPSAFAPNYTAGRYNGGAPGAAGQYWVNTYALNTRALYMLPALTLHEAVPGHHLQTAIARELVDVPAFRLNFYPHAFGEGWGLYAEKLGIEIGLYKTPYENFGRLSYEMWRACRLVVDTGIHSGAMTRDQARAYLSSNTSLSAHEIATEIDRYIAWPGQALAYKIGELKIWALRHRAQAALGTDFDIRDFHDAVLANGGVTLPVLEAQIESYIALKKVE